MTQRNGLGSALVLSGVAFDKILRSPHAHARIKNIDVSRALAFPGVKAVVTAAELPQPSGKVTDLGEGAMINPRFMSNNCLAKDKVLYKGHAVAAVAATSPHIAEEALALIDVDYEVLPAVITAQEAMREDAPILHERLMPLANPNLRPGGLREDNDTGPGTNVANHFVFEIGDVAQGFREADVIVEREYHTSTVHQGYIEPHSATALWNADGSLIIWCSSQGHFAIRDQTARIAGHSGLQSESDPDGDRRRLWGEDVDLPGAGRRAVVEENRASGEACDEPDRGVSGDRPHVRHPHPDQDGGEERWAHHGR